MNVLVTYDMGERPLALLREAGLNLIVLPGAYENDFAAIAALPASEREAVTALIGSALNANERLFALLPNLKWIHHPAAGLTVGDKTVDWELIRRREVAVTASKIHARTISELVVGMKLAFSKHLLVFHDRQKVKNYSENRPVCEMIDGETILIVGAGRIGAEIGRKFKLAFGHTVYGINTSGAPVEHFDHIGKMDRLEEWLPLADTVVLACAVTPETQNLMNARRLALMKKTALLINIGRGQLVNEDDLCAALTNHTIRAAALDVFAVEPLPKESPLWDIENLLITPHVAGLHAEYQASTARHMADNLSLFRDGRWKEMKDLATFKGY